MKIITAPDTNSVWKYYLSGDTLVFLAGGITDCPEWQKEVIKKLNIEDNHVIICNPRRDNFPIHDPNASYEQIEWEYKALNKCYIFSIMFCESTSDQPICFYELGRYIERMKLRFPKDWKNRIIVSCDDEFKRIQDVLIQTKLATSNRVKVNVGKGEDLINTHVHCIEKAVEYIRG